jgi:hypothetical protein
MMLMTNSKESRRKLLIATVSSAVIIAVLAAYFLLTSPGILKPSEVALAGSVTVDAGDVPEKITFTSTRCGTPYAAAVSGEGNSGEYSVVLPNGYSYNVTITLKSGETEGEMDVGTLNLDTFEASVTRNWVG